MGGLDTLRGMIAEGATVTAYCANPECRRSDRIDLGSLAARLGGDYSIQRNRTGFMARLRCRACGDRCDAIIIGTAYADSVDHHFEQGRYRYGTGAASIK